MADSRTLNLILELKDKASKELNSAFGNWEQGARKAGVAATAVGAAITGFAAVAVKEAAIAEGALNKFNTVFAEGSDEMSAFVDEIRKEMPTARQEIVSMAANMQDLLVPMTKDRDLSQKLTKDFLDLSNKLAAFNDVDPSKVLESIGSGLRGSSEPLTQFGVDARISTLEATALKNGLLEVGQTFANIDPAMRTAVQAQALLIQVTNDSSDAIEGFAVNQDSAIRRTQELKAQLKEQSAAIGEILLPIYDQLQKALIPIITKIAEWTKENPKLFKAIVIVTAALGALMLVLGPILIILPALVAGVKALIVVMGVLLGPVGLVIAAIAALIAIGYLIIQNWEEIKIAAVEIWTGLGIMFGEFIENMLVRIDKASKAIRVAFAAVTESVAGFFTNMWEGIKSGITSGINWVIDKLNSFIAKANKVISSLNEVPGVNFPNISQIPKLAKGGIVSKPTIAMIGEAGPEAVVPLPRMNEMGGGGNVTVIVNGDVSGRDLVDKVKSGIMGDMRMNQVLAL